VRRLNKEQMETSAFQISLKEEKTLVIGYFSCRGSKMPQTVLRFVQNSAIKSLKS